MNKIKCQDQVMDIALSPNYLVAGLITGKVQLYKLDDYKLIWTKQMNSTSIRSLLFTPDYLYSASKSMISRFTIDKVKQRINTKGITTISNLNTPMGNLIGVGKEDGNLIIYSNKLIQLLKIKFNDSINQLYFNEQKQHLFVLNESISVYDLNKNKLISKIELQDDLMDISLFNDLIYVCSLSGYIYIFNYKFEFVDQINLKVNCDAIVSFDDELIVASSNGLIVIKSNKVKVINGSSVEKIKSLGDLIAIVSHDEFIRFGDRSDIANLNNLNSDGITGQQSDFFNDLNC
jgi:hypothetical protein